MRVLNDFPPSPRVRPARSRLAAALIGGLLLSGCTESPDTPPVESGVASGDLTPAAQGQAAATGGAPATSADSTPGETDTPNRSAPRSDSDDPVIAILDALPPLEATLPTPSRAVPPALAPMFRLIEQRRTGPARVRLKKHLDLQPDDAIAAFLFGLSYHRERKYSEASPWFDRAIAADPSYDLPFYFSGWARLNLGRPEVARRLFNRHLALNPQAADSHFGIGLIDLEAGRAADAEIRFRSAIELESDVAGRERHVAKSWARLGDALYEQSRVADARAALDRSVELWPDHHEAWAALARVARRQGDDAAAERAEAEQARILERSAGAAPDAVNGG